MATHSWIIILLTITFSVLVHCEKEKVYYLEDYCKVRSEAIFLSYFGENSFVRIRAQRGSGYTLGRKCSVIVTTNIYYRIDVVLNKVDIRRNSTDCIDYLYIQNLNDGPGKLCSTNITKTSFDSSGNYIQIDFFTNGNGSVPQEGFDALLTATYIPARNDICEKKQFQCDNGKCVWKGLLCNGYNNCGDWSDERYCKRDVPAPLGSIIAILFICLITCLCVVCMCYFCKRKKVTVQSYQYIDELPVSSPNSPPVYSERDPLLLHNPMENNKQLLADLQDTTVYQRQTLFLYDNQTSQPEEKPSTKP